MPKTKSEKITTIVLAVIALLIIAVLVWFFVPFPSKHTSDQDIITTAYSRIKLPQSLHFKDRRWDDRNALDPAIHSDWKYTYTVADGTSTKQTAQAIETVLKQQGLTVSKGFNAQSPDEFSIDARNSDVWLSIYVGLDVNSPNQDTSTGNDVLITAEKPEL